MADIRWLGHNCFRVRGREAVVITDPVDKITGYTMTKQTADIVTLSHKHKGHVNLGGIKPEFVVLDSPGEYELHNVFVFGIRTYHDKEHGKERGYNTMFRFTLDGVTFGHLGDLGHEPNDEQLEEMEGIDVLFVPAGGGPVLSPGEMADVVGTISPKVIIPMQIQTSMGDKDRADASEFARQLSLELPEAVDRVSLKPADIGDAMRIILMSPST